MYGTGLHIDIFQSVSAYDRTNPGNMVSSIINYNYFLLVRCVQGTLNKFIYIQNMVQPILLSFLKQESIVNLHQVNAWLMILTMLCKIFDNFSG